MRPASWSEFPEIVQDYAAGIFKSGHARGMVVDVKEYGQGMPSYDKNSGK